MEVKFKSKDLDVRMIYKHTRASAISLKDVEDGTVIEPDSIVIYEDSNSNGDATVITSIIAKDGTHYASSSRIFREELAVIYNLMKGEDFAIKVVKKITKAGRTYVTCELA